MVAPVIPHHIGKYVVREQIGRGGMGLVYRAFDPALEREVAIKIIHTAKLNFADQITRFAAEALTELMWAACIPGGASEAAPLHLAGIDQGMPLVVSVKHRRRPSA